MTKAKQIKVTENRALRLMFGTVKTAKIDILNIESGILPRNNKSWKRIQTDRRRTKRKKIRQDDSTSSQNVMFRHVFQKRIIKQWQEKIV